MIREKPRVVAYQLVIELRKSVRLAVGGLGHLRFPAGRYVYTGSARRNLEARIHRHLSLEKNLRWHIDYLLADRNARIVRVERCAKEECSLNQAAEGVVLFPRFGASDCRRGCGSHLKYQDPRGVTRSENSPPRR